MRKVISALILTSMLTSICVSCGDASVATAETTVSQETDTESVPESSEPTLDVPEDLLEND